MPQYARTVGVGSQVATNALNGKPLGDGVLMAGAIGLASSVGMGAAAKVGGKVLGKVLGRAAEAAESEVAGAAEEAESSLASDVEEGASCALSFAPDTQVATPSGEQAIGTLQVGDHVTAYDPATGKTSTQTVQHVWINHDTDLIDVTLRVADQQQAASVQNKQQEVALRAHGLRAPPDDAAELTAAAMHDELIHTTAKHPWLTTDRGFVLAGTLHRGERVVREDGTPATVVTVAVRPGAADYYNLTVSVLHTYAVGASHFVVHNTGPACSLGGGDGATGKKTYVIGENMERVKAYARKNGFDYWKSWNKGRSLEDFGGDAAARTEDYLRRDVSWVKRLMAEGHTIVDIGYDRTRRVLGTALNPFYPEELETIGGAGYRNFYRDPDPGV